MPLENLKMHLKQKPNTYLLLGLVILLGIFLRVSLTYKIPMANADAILFSWIGVNIAHGGGYTIMGGEPLYEYNVWRVPLYPLFLSLFYKTFGTGFVISKLPSLFFGILIIPLTYLIATTFFSRTVGILSAIFVSFNSVLIIYSTEIMPESMFTFFLLLYLLFLVRSKEGGSKYPFLCGISAGLCYLTKPAGLFILPVGVIYLLLVNRGRLGKYPFIMVLGFGIFTFPYWYWTEALTGTPFAHEQSTAIYQYYQELGHYPEGKISIIDYLRETYTISEMIKTVLLGFIFIGWQITDYFTILGPIILLLTFFSRDTYKQKRTHFPLIAITTLGLIVPAWQVHLVKGDTILRYILPYLPVLYIYFSSTLLKIAGKGRVFQAATILISLLVINSSLSLISNHTEYVNGVYDSQYDYILEDLPKDATLIASNPEKAKTYGYSHVYPLERGDFKEIVSHKSTGEAYLIIDSTSLYNNDQISLVTDWFAWKRPPEIVKMRGQRYYIMKYKITTNYSTQKIRKRGSLVVVLSFDYEDLVSDEGTANLPGILQLLDDHGANATFFVLGKTAKMYPESVRQIYEDGHSIGMHTYYHNFPIFEKQDAEIIGTIYNQSAVREWNRSFKGEDAFYQDLIRNQEAIKSATGNNEMTPRMFRSPSLVVNWVPDPVYFETLKRAGVDIDSSIYQNFSSQDAPMPFYIIDGVTEVPLTASGHILDDRKRFDELAKRSSEYDVPLVLYIHPQNMPPERLSTLDEYLNHLEREYHVTYLRVDEIVGYYILHDIYSIFES